MRIASLFWLTQMFGCVFAAEDAASAFSSRMQPFLQAHCVQCHGPEKQKAKINLSGSRDLDQLAKEQALWFRVLAQIESGEMPPEDARQQPSPQQRQAVAAWIRAEFTEFLAARQRREGRSKLRRLSRGEFSNTFEDLFGFRPDVTHLPEDGRVDGYSKIAAALPMSSDGSLGYLAIAEDLLRKWVLRPLPKPAVPASGLLASSEASRTVRALARESEQSKGHILELEEGTMVSFNTDTTSGPVRYPGCKVPGMHRIRVSVYGYQTGKSLPFGIYTGKTGAYPQIISLAAVLEAPPAIPAVLQTDIYLKQGDGIRLIPFGLGVPVPKNSLASKCRAPGLAVQWLEDVEPEQPLLAERFLTADFPPVLVDELRRAKRVVLRKDPQKSQLKDQAKSVTRDEFHSMMTATLKRVGERLFRRELSSAEISEIISEVTRQLDEGVTLETVFFNLVVRLMTSPDFFCVIEQPGELSDFALASRLSYFASNSTPDDALLELARKSELRNPKVLKEQTERLLNDPKSNRFVSEFVKQWLGLHAIDDTSPDSNLYPEYNELLKRSSIAETETYFRRMLKQNLSACYIVSSPWMLVDEELARHYGIKGVSGIALREMPLPDQSPYGGIWTQSAVMKVTANGTSTSPVKRGVWVSERLLGIHIPPPPPDIEPIDPDTRGAKTLREQLALHRSQGSCAACHAKFDPYGFALESFDVTGRFRTRYRELEAEVAKLPRQRNGRSTWRDGLPVDCSGVTPDGRSFSGIADLRTLLKDHPEKLARGLARHLITYATGAPPGAVDEPAVERIVKSAATDDFGLRSLIHALIQDELFRCK